MHNFMGIYIRLTGSTREHLIKHIRAKLDQVIYDK